MTSSVGLAGPTGDVYCTLFEGNYHVGAASLINSLERAGVSAVVCCGYRGRPPDWIEQTTRLVQVQVDWIPLQVDKHFTRFKPDFMLQCLQRHHARRIYYADPDLVVKAPAPVLQRWAADGIAVVEDVNGDLPGRHPYRLRWKDYLAAAGRPVVRDLDTYFNAGFVGLPAELSDFLIVWRDLISDIEDHSGDISGLKQGNPNTLFHVPDQDALNMAFMLGDWPINGVGPDGMDFAPGGTLLSHATGTPKPWEVKSLTQWRSGRPVSAAQRQWLLFASGPIQALAPKELALAARGQSLAAAVSRVYRRS